MEVSMAEFYENTENQSSTSAADEPDLTPKKKEKKLKSAKTALLLALFFGEFGFDRIYLGYWFLGILKFLTLGGLGIWWVFDAAKIMSLQMKDKHGRPLSLN